MVLSDVVTGDVSVSEAVTILAVLAGLVGLVGVAAIAWRLESRRAPVEGLERREGWALFWLSFGLALAPLGSFIGVYLVARSERWTARWKVAALAWCLALVVGVLPVPMDGAGGVVVRLGVLALLALAAWKLLRVADEATGPAQSLGRAPAVALGLLASILGSTLVGYTVS